MQGFDDIGAGPGLRGVVADDEFATRPRRFIESLEHLGAIDVEVGDVVIGVEKRNPIEIMHAGGCRIAPHPTGARRIVAGYLSSQMVARS